MRLLIAGSRTIKDYQWLCNAIGRFCFENAVSADQITEVVSGKEPNGVDGLGERWAKEHGIPVKPFPAKWRTGAGNIDYSAGPQRNSLMALYADAAIILRRPRHLKSNGSDDMYNKMKHLNKPVYREIEGDKHD